MIVFLTGSCFSQSLRTVQIPVQFLSISTYDTIDLCGRFKKFEITWVPPFADWTHLGFNAIEMDTIFSVAAIYKHSKGTTLQNLTVFRCMKSFGSFGSLRAARHPFSIATGLRQCLHFLLYNELCFAYGLENLTSVYHSVTVVT